MRYNFFREKMKKYPFFRSNTFKHLTDKQELLRNQLSKWIKDGYIIVLKRGMYTLREQDRETKFSRYFLANNLYVPSYISLESALSFYDLIPEKVVTVTSVTSKKTQQFKNPYGNFLYRHIRNDLFNDFVKIQDEYGNNFFIASKERALVDFLYFHTRGLNKFDDDIFEISFRLQNLDTIDTKKLLFLTKQFQQKKLTNLITLLINKINT